MMILGLAYRYELQALNELLEPFAAQKQAASKKASQLQLQSVLAHFRRCHTKLSVELAYLNDRLISPFLYSFILSYTVMNVAVIMFVLYRPLAPFFMAFLLGAFCGQLSLMGLALWALIPVNIRLYGSTRALFVLCNRVSRFQDHWSAATYYELLHRKKRKPLIICAGPLGTLNRKSIFQVNKKRRFFVFI
jgi:hypothetical protein